MFSNSTDGDLFTGAFCARCRFAYDPGGTDELCDEASVILWGEDPPDFLVRVPLSEDNPVGVICTRIELRNRTAPG